MSGYPDPNYASIPQYPSTAGTSCENPKPSWYWEGGTFCNDVTINGNLSVGGNTDLKTLNVKSMSIEVGGLSYGSFLFLNSYDGRYYYVLAHQLSKTFTPPPVP